MSQSFTSLALQPPIETPLRQMVRRLPESAVAWVDIGLLLAFLAMLRLG